MILDLILILVISFLLITLYGSFRVWQVDRKEIAKLKLMQATIENNAKTEIEDISARYNELRKVPVLACMSDNQVSVLAEMLAIHIREIMEKPEDYVN